MFTVLTVGNNTYNLKLNARSCINLEKALGRNPVSVFMEIDPDNGKLPSAETVITMLQACLAPMNHGMDMNKTFDLYDQYVEEGHTMYDLIPLFVEVFQNSGYLPKQGEETAEKN